MTATLILYKLSDPDSFPMLHCGSCSAENDLFAGHCVLCGEELETKSENNSRTTATKRVSAIQGCV